MAAQKARKTPGKPSYDPEAEDRRPRPVKRQAVKKEPAFKPKPTRPAFDTPFRRTRAAYWACLEGYLHEYAPNDKQGRRKARKMANRLYTLLSNAVLNA